MSYLRVTDGTRQLRKGIEVNSRARARVLHTTTVAVVNVVVPFVVVFVFVMSHSRMIESSVRFSFLFSF